MWIDGKNPDFISKTKNKIIEVFGDYWHSEQITNLPNDIHVNNVITHYSKNGYDTLIIWEHEFKNMNSIKEKVILFNKVSE